MLTGVVNQDLEAIVHIDLADRNGSWQSVESLVDTGFNGFLTLPESIIEALQLPWRFRQDAMLADGTIHEFDVYQATVRWNGVERTVEVEAIDAQSLAGMSLLEGTELRVQVMRGGDVSVTSIP